MSVIFSIFIQRISVYFCDLVVHKSAKIAPTSNNTPSRFSNGSVRIAIMAAAVALPSNEFFSESYMEAFYKAHIASTRTHDSGALDEDIAAIEAEIRK